MTKLCWLWMGVRVDLREFYRNKRFFMCFLLFRLIYPILLLNEEKKRKNVKKQISTSQQSLKHLFTGQNIQHFFLFVQYFVVNRNPIVVVIFKYQSSHQTCLLCNSCHGKVKRELVSDVSLVLVSHLLEQDHQHA